MAKSDSPKQQEPMPVGADLKILLNILNGASKEEKLASLRRIGVIGKEGAGRKGWSGAKQTSPIEIPQPGFGTRTAGTSEGKSKHQRKPRQSKG